MEQKKSKSITYNALLRVILNVFNVIIPIITGPYLARTLDVELYGIYNKSLSLIGFLLPFAGFGIYNYGIREISKLKDDEKKRSKLFTMLFVVGAGSSLIVLVCYVMYLLGAIALSHKMIYYIMTLQIIAVIFNVEYMHEAFENYQFIVCKTLLVRILNVILILSCVRRPDDVIIYAFIYSFLQFLNYFLSFWYIKRQVRFVKISPAEIKNILKPLLVVFLLMNCNMLYTNLDRLVMSVFSDGIYVTYYTFSQTIMNLLMNVLNSIILVTIPRLSNYIGQKKFQEYSALVHNSSGVFFMLGIPICIGFFVLSDVIMFLYGGDQYVGAGLTFGLFSIRMLVWIVEYVIANQILFVQGYEKTITKIYFIGGILNILFKIILIMNNAMRSEIMIFSTTIAEILVLLMEIYYVTKYHIERLKNLIFQYLRYFVIAITFVVVGVVNRELITFTYAMDLQMFKYVAVTIIECVCIYLGALLIMKDKNLLSITSVVMGKMKKLNKKMW